VFKYLYPRAKTTAAHRADLTKFQFNVSLPQAVVREVS